MEDDWTPIQRAGANGAPIDLMERDGVIRRLQDGLLVARAKLVVSQARPEIAPFILGDKIERSEEADFELPASLWASDKLGHIWLNVWTTGDEHLSLNRGYDGEGATFYGIELPDTLHREAKGKGGKGRPKGAGGFAVSDAPIVEKMRDLINKTSGMTGYGAAQNFVAEAAGNAGEETKRRRLADRYNKTKP